jgi:hypothetical protein
MLLLVSIMVPAIGDSYIPPSTQIIGFMVGKYASVKTLQITQLTKALDLGRGMETVFGESISLMSPGRYRSEVAGQPGKRIIIHNGSKTLRIIDGKIAYGKGKRAFPFHFLMIAQDPWQLQRSLKELGINLDMVSLTRCNGKIAYLIGNKESESPRLLVDKDLFTPLLLQYGDVAFFASEFTELKQRLWYPRSLIYAYTGANIEDYVQEEYSIKDIIINPSIDASLFDISGVTSRFVKSR